MIANPFDRADDKHFRSEHRCRAEQRVSGYESIGSEAQPFEIGIEGRVLSHDE